MEDQGQAPYGNDGEPLPPATREELFALVVAILKSAKMPPSRKRSRFVTIPAELHQAAHAMLQRDLGVMQLSSDGETVN